MQSYCLVENSNVSIVTISTPNTRKFRYFLCCLYLVYTFISCQRNWNIRMIWLNAFLFMTPNGNGPQPVKFNRISWWPESTHPIIYACYGIMSYSLGYIIISEFMRFIYSYPLEGLYWHETWARFLSLARSKLRLCPANHRPGYWSNLPCDWPSTAWAYSE